MTPEMMQYVLGWAAALNLGVLTLWFLFLMFARDFVYKTHSRWFKMPEDKVGALHYGLIGAYELMIFVFLLGPYFGLNYQ